MARRVGTLRFLVSEVVYAIAVGIHTIGDWLAGNLVVDEPPAVPANQYEAEGKLVTEEARAMMAELRPETPPPPPDEDPEPWPLEGSVESRFPGLRTPNAYRIKGID